ncbi:MAG: S9 family peptidase [Saprospiraceae bacterium]
MKSLISILITFGLFIHTSAQSLTLEQIMKGDEFIGHSPTRFQWSYDGSTIYFNWNPDNEPGSSTYYWKNGMAKPEKLPADQKENVSIPFKNQQDYETIYYLKNGGIYSFNKKDKTTKKVYFSSNKVNNLSRGTDKNVIYFQQGDNIYQMNTSEVSIIQLTNFKKSKEADKPAKDNFLKKQQKELFTYIQDSETKKVWNEKRSKENTEFFPKEYIYDPYSLNNLTPSPDGKFICFQLSDYPKAAPTKVEHFIQDDGYTKNVNARPKVSVNNLGDNKYWIYNVEKDTFYMINFDGLTGINAHPAYYLEYPALKEKENKAKPIEQGRPVFNKSGSRTVMEIRSQDNKDRWIISIDLLTGNISELDHQHDEAWINGPGIGYGSGTLGFLHDDNTIFFQSEASGYSHLYLMDLTSGQKKQLTNGKWEVRDVTLSNDGNSFYLTTNTTHPGNRSFYRLDIATGKMNGILTRDGAHEVELSPDEKSLLIRYSFKNQPWELFIAENNSNPALQQITHSTTEAFKKYNWRQPEVITFKAKDGQEVYARLYQPKSKSKNKAAVIFVHGAGYLQNAHNHWSSYHREYMFHNLLTDKGYTVLDIDYRGSDGYGRDVRTGIYRHMGGLDLSDQLDGKKFLVDKLHIDKNKVGIYGGSYGGFITLMALLTEPGTFKAGAALRSVTDWAHYNHGYTSNILNFPETDSIAYRRSSPIYFAENLKDRLVMLHGMVDDNVQFQDVVRLSQRFIELGKKNWDLAVFPVESHGFTKTSSWVDEYRRILELFDEELLGK